MIRNVTNFSVHHLLSRGFYRVEQYQRPYSWDRDQWDELFEDIQDNNEDYFLGSVICIDNPQSYIPASYIHFIENSNPQPTPKYDQVDQKRYDDQRNENNQQRSEYYSRYDIVDGQQRITTLSLLIAALVYTIAKIDRTYPERRILNPEEQEQFVLLYSNAKQSLINRLNQGRSPYIRLSLTQQYGNNDHFNSVVSFIGGNQRNYDFINLKSNIHVAFVYFVKIIYKRFIISDNKIEEDIDFGEINYENKNPNIQGLFSFLSKLLSARIVSIDVNERKSAFILFSSINNRGLDLAIIDLIKNDFFSRLDSNNEINLELEWNNKLLKNLEHDDHIKYLRHYRHARDIEYVSKSSLLDRYIASMNNNVTEEFRNFINYSGLYKELTNPNGEKACNESEIILRLNGLSELGVSAAYALLLYIYAALSEQEFDRSDKEGFLISVLKEIESFYVRRHLTDFPKTRALDDILIGAIRLLKTNEFTCESNFDDIAKKIKLYFRDNPEHWANQEHVDLALKGDFYKNQTLARYIFSRLEQYKTIDIARNLQPCRFFERTQTRNPKPKWTVEHIHPQNPAPRSEWSDWTDANLLHNIGNLTITTYNSKLGNKSFLEKKNGVSGYKANGLAIDKYIIDQEVWTEENIKERASLLIKDINDLFFN